MKIKKEKVDYRTLKVKDKILFHLSNAWFPVALIFFIFLSVVTRNPGVAFVIAIAIGSYLGYVHVTMQNVLKIRRSGLNNHNEFDVAFAALLVAIAKAEGEVSKVEIEYIERRIREEFFYTDYESVLLLLRDNFKREKIFISAYTGQVERDFSVSEKVQLLHVLVGLALADKLLTSAEESLLQQITREIGIPYRTLDSILAMYRFQREFEQKKEKPKSSYKTALNDAYKILEIEVDATAQEIKKAYKKLAIIHHPDKVAHLGDDIQKKAAEKFKIIVGAYDLICDAKGIV